MKYDDGTEIPRDENGDLEVDAGAALVTLICPVCGTHISCAIKVYVILQDEQQAPGMWPRSVLCARAVPDTQPLWNHQLGMHGPGLEGS